jgi:hypothetical protein
MLEGKYVVAAAPDIAVRTPSSPNARKRLDHLGGLAFKVFDGCSRVGG